MSDLVIINSVQRVEVNRVSNPALKAARQFWPDIDPDDWRFWGSPIHCEPSLRLYVTTGKQ